MVNTRKLLLNTRILLQAQKNCYLKSLESRIKSEWERNIIVSAPAGNILLTWQQMKKYFDLAAEKKAQQAPYSHGFFDMSFSVMALTCSLARFSNSLIAAALSVPENLIRLFSVSWPSTRLTV